MIVELDNVWPVLLPLPFIDYSGQPRNATLVSPPENLAYLRRSRYTRSYNTLAVSWILTPEQLESFKEFFETDLANGTSQFQIELRFPKNSELTLWAVKFLGGYNTEWLEGPTAIQATLDLITPILLDEEESS